MMDDDLSEMTAVEAVRAIRRGALSAEDYVDAALARADDHAHLNAFVALDADGARAAARTVDHAVAQGASLPPLAGLPIAVKDNIDWKGLPTTGATPALRANVPSRTAPVLRALVDAGAIPLGKTNMHELALGFTTVNHTAVPGTTRNPYDHGRIAGGSSGGTAAAIAARIVPVGLGSDTGGSVRIPAALCGITALRPSVGDGGPQRRYSSEGVLPISTTRDTLGPMARTVADIALLDAVVTATPLATPLPIDGLRLGIARYFWDDLHPDVAAVAARALSTLDAAGVVLVDADVPELHELHDLISMPLLAHEFSRDLPLHLTRSGSPDSPDLRDIASAATNPEVHSFIQTSMAGGHARAHDDAIRIHRPRLQEMYGAYFATNGLAAMIFPTSPHPAAPIGADAIVDGGLDLYMRNTSPASCIGAPGLTLFAGSTDGGLPVGIELDGPLGSDRRLLAWGLTIERLLGAPPPPPPPHRGVEA